MAEVTIRKATVDDSRIVAALVLALLKEIDPPFAATLTLDGLRRVAATLLAEGQGFWAFLAIEDDGNAVGALTLNECAALYAEGRFGVIVELYVDPPWRSAKTGAKLIDAAVAFGRRRGWPLLEVGTAGQPKWRRSLDFYRGYGFKETGVALELDL